MIFTIRFVLLTTLFFFSYSSFCQELIPYFEDAKYGYCDVEGLVKIQAKYNEVGLFNDDSLAVVVKGDNKVLIDNNGKELLTYPKESLFQFAPIYFEDPNYIRRSERKELLNLKCIKINNSDYHLINLLTKQVSSLYSKVPPKYLLSCMPLPYFSFENGYHVGRVSDVEFEVVDTCGGKVCKSEVLPRILNDSLILFTSLGNPSLYNANSKVVREYPYGAITEVIDSKYIVVASGKSNSSAEYLFGQNRKYGLVDVDGRVLLDTIYHGISYSNGLFILSKGQGSFLSNLDQILCDTNMYKRIYALNDNCFGAVGYDGRTSIIDLEGNALLSSQSFDECTYVEKGNYYIFKDEDRVAMLDSNFIVKMECKGEYLNPIDNCTDLYYVWQDRKKGIVDVNGNMLIPHLYESINLRGEVFILRTRMGHYGLSDMNGKMLIDTVYEEVKIIDLNGDTIVRVKKDGNYGGYSKKCVKF